MASPDTYAIYRGGVHAVRAELVEFLHGVNGFRSEYEAGWMARELLLQGMPLSQVSRRIGFSEAITLKLALKAGRSSEWQT
jgi:hypothetical protein